MSKTPLIEIRTASSLPANWPDKIRRPDRKSVQSLQSSVETIIKKVRTHGDTALVSFAKKFDKANLDIKKLRVTAEEVKTAYGKVGSEEISALEFMKTRVEALEKRILQQMSVKVERNGVRVRNLPRPIDSVGCYVPGGEASYPSTLVMTVVPAKVAGVPRVVVCSPPTAEGGSIDPLTLVAADICRVDEIYKVGGVQAIAALAYGTQSIEPVRKIVGPGNRYVSTAKILVSKDVAVDMVAGPSEILVLADETASPRLVSLDMISQAEHGRDSVAGLITTSRELANNVLKEIGEILAGPIGRGTIVEEAISKHGFVIVCRGVSEMVELANSFAPEHVEVLTRLPLEVAEKIASAGLVLTGPFCPVAASDYGIGTNHVLPTGGSACVSSGLSVLDFVRRVGIVECSRDGLLELKKSMKVLAEAENLPNHYAAVEGRFGH